MKTVFDIKKKYEPVSGSGGNGGHETDQDLYVHFVEASPVRAGRLVRSQPMIQREKAEAIKAVKDAVEAETRSRKKEIHADDIMDRVKKECLIAFLSSCLVSAVAVILALIV